MSRLCPHCRFPFDDPDWDGDGLPALCPRCGTRLAEPGAGNPRIGIASFLHKPGEAEAEEQRLQVQLPPRPAVTHDEGREAAQHGSAPAPAAAPGQAGNPPDPTPAAADAGAVASTVARTAASAAPGGADDGGVPAAPLAQDELPAFARRAAPPEASRRSLVLQWLAVAALSLLLALQLLLADRDRLGADAQWRPVLLSLCNVFGCELSPWREPRALTMLERDVRAVPGQPGALQVVAEFRNDARWAQPLPVLHLRLSDADGRRLGERSFTAAEYAGDGSTALLAPGQSHRASFRIREPGRHAAAFQFEFR